jgi:uncharacterized repeat protein (TIGR01451 family)
VFRRFTPRALAAAAAVAVVGLISGLAVPAAYAAGGLLGIIVQVQGEGAPSFERGDTFSYQIQVDCQTEDCAGAVVVTQFPVEFDGLTLRRDTTSLTGTNTDDGGTPVSSTIVWGGIGNRELTVTFTDALDGGAIGLRAGTAVTISVNVDVPSNLSPDWVGNALMLATSSSVTATGSSAASASANAQVTVPVTVAAFASTSWVPASTQYRVGGEVTVRVGVGNDANVAATSVTSHIPTSPEAVAPYGTPNPFRFLDFVRFASITYPQGADRVQAWVLLEGASDWIAAGGVTMAPALPDISSLTDIQRPTVVGVRLIFTADGGRLITAEGTHGRIDLVLAQREVQRGVSTPVPLSERLLLGYSALNTVRTVVVASITDQQASALASSTLTVSGLNAAVTGTLTFIPGRVPEGTVTTARLTARNDSNGPVGTMTLDAAGFFDSILIADEIGSVTWPNGAVSATVSWQLTAGAPIVSTIVPGGALPDAPAGATGVTIVFTAGADGIAQGASATVNLLAEVSLGSGSALGVGVSRTVVASVTNDAGTASLPASATLRIFDPEIRLTLVKSVGPGMAVPSGGRVTVRLQASTESDSAWVRPTRIVISDAGSDVVNPDFWDAFDASWIGATQVPQGSTLVVEYRTTDSGGVHTWTQHGSIVDAQFAAVSHTSTFTAAERAAITGLSFTFTNPTGFAQGTTVAPTIGFLARETLRGTSTPTATAVEAVTYSNIATATAVGSVGFGTPQPVNASASSAATAQIKFLNTATGGGGNLGVAALAQKAWSGTGPLTAQSAQQRTATLRWGTEVTGIASVTVMDPAPITTGGSIPPPSSQTIFATHDLVSIGAITESTDPLFRYDELTQVALYRNGAWMSLRTCTEAAPCVSWANYNLSTIERSETTAVRFVFRERTSGATRLGDAAAPAPGSGVTSSPDGRPLPLVFALRNSMRDQSVDYGCAPIEGTKWVMGTCTFNDGAPSNSIASVRNTMSVTLVGQDFRTGSADASASLTIVNGIPAVNVTKTSTSTALTVPHVGDVAVNSYPTTIFRTDAINASVSRPWAIRTTDPAACETLAALASCSRADRLDAPFSTGYAYDASTNPFERFTVINLNYVIPSGVSASTSLVTLVRYDATSGVTTVDQPITLTAANALTATQLADVVAVSVLWVSMGTDGGAIASGDRMRLDLVSQLRSSTRSNAAVLVSPTPVGLPITNVSFAQTFDPVNETGTRHHAADDATVALLEAIVDVTAHKTLSRTTILEQDRATLITATLRATEGNSTASMHEVVISDDTEDFWNTFQLSSIQSVTRPYSAGSYRIDTQSADGAWVLGTPVMSGVSLPAGVSSDDVHGLRVRYIANADRSAIFSTAAVPPDWSAQIVFRVAVRDQDAGTGGAIVWDRSLSNTVTTQSMHDEVGRDQATAQATVLLDAGTAVLDVSKQTARTATAPGETFNWTIRVRNAGTGFIDNPVVIDQLPSDASVWGGPLLFDPTDVPTVTTSSGGILPVLQSATAYVAANRTVTISWPAGSRIAPGEAVTIVLPLQIAPALPATTTITNTVTVQSSVVIDTCLNTVNSRGVTVSSPVSCRTTQQTTTFTASALATFKGVIGDSTNISSEVSGAQNTVNPATPCVANNLGYYRFPCAANTLISATDEWYLRSINGGNVAATALSIVDVLPKTGDRRLATGASRNSQFTPVFTGNVRVQLDAAAGGATTQTYVTTHANPCPAFLSDPQCASTSGVAWTLLSSFAPDRYDTITALRIDVDFSEVSGGLWAPGSTIEVRYDTVNTAAKVPGDDRVSVTVPVANERAWNSYGAAARFQGEASWRAVEPQKAGVQTASGPVQIDKAIDGEYADRNPNTSYTMQVRCSVGGVRVAMPNDGEVIVSAAGTPSYSTRVDGIPLGSECSIVEIGGGASAVRYTTTAATSSDAGVVTISGAGAASTPPAQIVTVTNSYGVGQLQVTKVASTDITEGGETFAYAITVSNTGVAVATGVTVTDDLADELRFVSGSGVGWSCGVTGADGDGFGGTVLCALADDLAVAQMAGVITVTVDVLSTVAVDEIVNRAVVASTNPIVDGDFDDEGVLVRWLNVSVAPQCVLDAPWLYYVVSARNVDLSSETLNVSWANDTGVVRHAEVIAPTAEQVANGTMTGRILWPGAIIDADNRGVGWPGWRAVLPGEVAEWENLVFRPDAFGSDLRSGVQTTLSIGGGRTVDTVDYPGLAHDCSETPQSDVRVPEMGLSKTPRSTVVMPGGESVYDIVGWNDGLGAIVDVRMVDTLPDRLAYRSVTWQEPTDRSAPNWASCEATGAAADGFGGQLTCVLDRPLGFGQSTPTIVVTTTLRSGAIAGMTRNVVEMTGNDIDFPDLPTLSLETFADVRTPTPALAATGITLGGLAGHALLALLLGFGLVRRGRVSRHRAQS